jgi:hypothetical protein
VNFTFEPHQGLVIVRAELAGLSGSAVLRLALDTGSTSTLVSAGLLVAIGYDQALAPDRVEVTTASAIEYSPRVTLSKIVALAQTRTGFPVLAHTLPPSAGVDGLLGLDFFRGLNLTINFRNGQITLA